MAASSTSKSAKNTKTTGGRSTAAGKTASQTKKTPPRNTGAKKTPSKTQGKTNAKDPLAFRSFKAFLCLALAVVALIGCFTGEGLFIGCFRRFALGLVGKGFFFLPFLLLVAALQILMVRDKPIGMRVFCTLLLSVTAGALIHLFGCTNEFEWSWKIFGQLYAAGTLPGSAGSGGVLGGIFAEVFEHLFNRIGAAVVLIIASVFLLLVAMDTTAAAVIRYSRDKAARKKQEWAARRVRLPGGRNRPPRRRPPGKPGSPAPPQRRPGRQSLLPL